MNRYLKFYLTALIFLALPYYMAIAGDTFSTAMVSVPAFFFFGIGSVLYLVRAIQGRDIKLNLVKLVSALMLMVSLGIPMVISDQGLRTLTHQRMQIMADLKPVFMAYYADNRQFPENLEDLVPNYIDVIPEELNNDGVTDSYRRIHYERTPDGPIFIFHTARGPDSAASLNVVTGEYWHET